MPVLMLKGQCRLPQTGRLPHLSWSFPNCRRWEAEMERSHVGMNVALTKTPTTVLTTAVAQPIQVDVAGTAYLTLRRNWGPAQREDEKEEQEGEEDWCGEQEEG